jgi:hypothetical protein
MLVHKPRPSLARFVNALWLSQGYVPGPHRQERLLPGADCALILDLREGRHPIISGPLQTEDCSRSAIRDVPSRAATTRSAGLLDEPEGQRHSTRKQQVDQPSGDYGASRVGDDRCPFVHRSLTRPCVIVPQEAFASLGRDNSQKCTRIGIPFWDLWTNLPS